MREVGAPLAESIYLLPRYFDIDASGGFAHRVLCVETEFTKPNCNLHFCDIVRKTKGN